MNSFFEYRKIRELFFADADVLKRKAKDILKDLFDNKVYIRAIIELSNICQKNCFYCGLRKDNKRIVRYQMPEDQVVKLSLWAYKKGYRSIVLQSGERCDACFVEYIDRIIRAVKSFSNGEMNIVLSLGEQEESVYKLWRQSGADRYLLRIETSNEKLYSQLHPNDDRHLFKNRIRCLSILRKLGYQVGSGVMIGLPNQTVEDLISDIFFYYQMDIDMIGMGPYIPEDNTPLKVSLSVYDVEKIADLTLRMIAVSRIILKDVNIASTTALDALKPKLRLEAFNWGANVLMPDITPRSFKTNYLIYKNKDQITAESCVEALRDRIVWNDPGDPLHYKRRLSS